MFRVLAIEDSPTQAAELRLILDADDLAVITAPDGKTGLDRLAAEPFDLVLTDILLPGIDGYEVCRRIKTDPRLQSIPVVLITVLSDPLDILRGLECGADNFLTKPYDPAFLCGRVRKILTSRAGRANRPPEPGFTISFRGRGVTITSDKEQIVELLLSAVEDSIRAREREHEARVAKESLDAPSASSAPPWTARLRAWRSSMGPAASSPSTRFGSAPVGSAAGWGPAAASAATIWRLARRPLFRKPRRFAERFALSWPVSANALCSSMPAVTATARPGSPPGRRGWRGPSRWRVVVTHEDVTAAKRLEEARAPAGRRVGRGSATPPRFPSPDGPRAAQPAGADPQRPAHRPSGNGGSASARQALDAAERQTRHLGRLVDELPMLRGWNWAKCCCKRSASIWAGWSARWPRNAAPRWSKPACN